LKAQQFVARPITSPEQYRVHASIDLAEHVRQSRIAQGLPPIIEDVSGLDFYVVMVAEGLARAWQSKARHRKRRVR
jgi:hypothetical protein